MADSMDLVQERAEEMRQRNIANVLNKHRQPSRSFCIDCDASIPELRCRTLVGVERCVHCQQITEDKCKHIRGKV